MALNHLEFNQLIVYGEWTSLQQKYFKIKYQHTGISHYRLCWQCQVINNE